MLPPMATAFQKMHGAGNDFAIFDARDVREKLDAGASLVQVYSGMVYEGPGMAGRILRELTRQ